MGHTKDSPFLRFQLDRRPFLSGGGFLFLAFFFACSAPPVIPNNKDRSSVTIAVAGGAEDSDENIGFQQIWPLLSFEGLIDNRDPAGHPLPAIAESWSSSADKKQWRITLRPNVVFHDGAKCDAQAVKTILEAALKRPDISMYPGLLDIAAIQAEDDRTLVIQLRKPSAFLLEDLYLDITKKAPGGEQIGTGPYRLASRTKGEVTLEAHAQYAQGAPRIQQLVLKSFPTLRQAWSQLLRGEVDGVWYLSGDALEFLTAETVETFNIPRHYASAMVFNSQRPHLRAPAVRRALNAAIDRNAIIQSVLKGRGRPAYSPIWPNHWAVDQTVPGYSFDPSLAKTTLGALNRSKGDGPYGRLRITCLVPADNAIFERIALVLQTQLFDVGVDLLPESLPLSRYDARLRSGDYDAALIDLAAGPSLSRVYVFWRSPGEYKGLNVFGYRNADADRWLDRLRSAPDEATTRAATSQLQRVMLEDPPAIFLAWSEQARALSRSIDVGLPKESDPFDSVWKWQFVDKAQPTAE